MFMQYIKLNVNMSAILWYQLRFGYSNLQEYRNFDIDLWKKNYSWLNSYIFKSKSCLSSGGKHVLGFSFRP